MELYIFYWEMILWRHILKVYDFFVGWDSRECCESVSIWAAEQYSAQKNIYSIFKISAPKIALGRASAGLESCVGSNNPAWVSDPFTVFFIRKLYKGRLNVLSTVLRLVWPLSSCMFLCFPSWTSTVWNLNTPRSEIWCW